MKKYEEATWVAYSFGPMSRLAIVASGTIPIPLATVQSQAGFHHHCPILVFKGEDGSDDHRFYQVWCRNCSPAAKPKAAVQWGIKQIQQWTGFRG